MPCVPYFSQARLPAEDLLVRNGARLTNRGRLYRSCVPRNAECCLVRHRKAGMALQLKLRFFCMFCGIDESQGDAYFGARVGRRSSPTSSIPRFGRRTQLTCLASQEICMHNASPNDRPTAPAGVTPLLCSESQWRFLLPRKCFRRPPVFSPSMTETLTVLSISSAGVAALTSPGALRAHFPRSSSLSCRSLRKQTWASVRPEGLPGGRLTEKFRTPRRKYEL